jgi:hypothetical protein
METREMQDTDMTTKALQEALETRPGVVSHAFGLEDEIVVLVGGVERVRVTGPVVLTLNHD